ncbi:hypothetical protein [Nostoc sp.]|uniref:hypothetical protein n=1 Tax=Nostoc sp. TaxID=1180 RepID=UPI002FF68F5A
MRNPKGVGGVGGVGGWERSLTPHTSHTPHTPHTPLPLKPTLCVRNPGIPMQVGAIAYLLIIS